MIQAMIAPIYADVRRAYRHFSLLNGSLAALEFVLDPTGDDLGAWLTDPANLTQFERLITVPAGAAAMCASGTAMAAVAASGTAMAAVAASGTAMAAVAASGTAMAAVAASGTAMAVVAASGTAMAAVFGSLTAKAVVWISDAAVGAIADSQVAYDWLIANKAVTSAATNVESSPGTLFDSGKSLLLDFVMNATSSSIGVQFTSKQGTVGDATGPDSVGHRYTTTRVKNVMAVQNLTCKEGSGANTSNTVILRYVVMD